MKMMILMTSSTSENFKESKEGEFMSNDQRLAAPPWTSLGDFEYAVKQYEKNEAELDEASLKWINQLIAPGSSLGGARPKADVVDTTGKQWIAKFPSVQMDSISSGRLSLI
jgi:serine/threonine-protein kinase HipA